MIPARPGIVAVYAADREYEHAPVEAWGDDGVPYVLGPQGLIAAAQRPESTLVHLRYREVDTEIELQSKPEFVKRPTTVAVRPTPEEER